MINKSEMVATMIKQHRTLQAELGEAKHHTETEKPDAKIILKILKRFSKDLNTHLKLENDIFYIELLKEMRAKGEDTTHTELFIAEMKVIGDLIDQFLHKFNDAGTIASKESEFEGELVKIIDTYNLRIEVEEEGVYLYWS